MVRRRASQEGTQADACRETRLLRLASPKPAAGIPGPGRWLVVSYLPTALFSLKTSLATSSVGKTLIVPTPYAIKMALVDAAFRAGVPDDDCAAFLRALIGVQVRIAAPDMAVVTHTFVKVRQEPHGGSQPDNPYISNIAYREMAHHQGVWHWAFDLAGADDAAAGHLVQLAPYISYIGKRGSFIQFAGIERASELDDTYTTVPQAGDAWPISGHVAALDDFGPEATLDILSSFSLTKARRDRHRAFVHTVIPLGATNTGPGFTEYRRE